MIRKMFMGFFNPWGIHGQCTFSIFPFMSSFDLLIKLKCPNNAILTLESRLFQFNMKNDQLTGAITVGY